LKAANYELHDRIVKLESFASSLKSNLEEAAFQPKKKEITNTHDKATATSPFNLLSRDTQTLNLVPKLGIG
jgi:hypothetical protein